MILRDKSIHRGNLILVNSRYPVVGTHGRQYVPVNHGKERILLERRSATILSDLFRTIGSGGSIVPVSGYRTKREQQEIYSQSVKTNGETFTKKYVALPDHSEHQTGFAIDLGLQKENIDFICPDFPYDGICQTFRTAAVSYGFIERYRKDKEDITGISHEPWHFRYVGWPHSEIIERRRLALEEYTELIRQHPWNGATLQEEVRGQPFEIFYVPEERAEEVNLPALCMSEVSGNNSDGYIVTVWGRIGGR